MQLTVLINDQQVADSANENVLAICSRHSLGAPGPIGQALNHLRFLFKQISLGLCCVVQCLYLFKRLTKKLAVGQVCDPFCNEPLPDHSTDWNERDCVVC